MVFGRIMTLAAVAMLCNATPAQAEPRKGARIEFAQERLDIGTVKQGEQATRVIEFRNTGNELLIIHKVQSS